MRALILLVVAGCAKKPPPEVVGREPANVLELEAGAVALEDAAPAKRLERPWKSAAGAGHPLVGWVFSSMRGTFADWDTMVEDLRGARYVFLGEKHDNADHHLLQAEVISALGPGAVVFEQLDLTDDVAAAKTPAELAAAAAWADSGWPAFEIYEPVFAAAYAKGAAVVPGHPARAWVDQVMAEGFAALPPEAKEGLPEDPKLPERLQADLAEEIADSHCGMATPELTDKMTRAQLLKDTTLARELKERAPAEGGAPTVLVAGNGHARGDRGVPFWLDGERKTVAFLEVADGEFDPARYVEGADWLVFTPRVDDEDPCAAFKTE